MADDKGFVGGMNETEAVQLCRLVSKVTGAGSFVFGIASGLLAESDADKIIKAIGRLLESLDDALRGIIDSVKNAVNKAHTVELKWHVGDTLRPDDPVISFDGYFHAEHGRPLEFFAASTNNDDDPTLAEALASAQKARDRGVAGDLANMGIPEFETLLDKWRKTLATGSALRVLRR